MKKFLLIISIFLLVGCKQSEPNRNYGSLDSRSINGPVKTIAHNIEGETSLNYINEGYYTYTPFQTDYYDTNGNITKSVEYYHPESSVLLYEYNKFNQNTAWHIGMIRSEDYIDNRRSTVFIDDVEVQITFEYAIDEQVKDGIVDTNAFMPNGIENIPISHAKEEYKDYKLIHSETIDYNSKEKSFTDYKYNSDGFMTEFKQYESDGHVTYKFECNYNNKNLMTDYTMTDDSVTTITITYLDYDKYDNWIKAEFTTDDETFIIKREFDYYR